MVMKTSLLAALAVTSLWAAYATAGEAKKDLDKFQGTWVPVRVEVNGKPSPKESLESIKLEVKGDQFAITIGDMTVKGTLKLDPSQNPKAYDATGVRDGKEVKTVGIYAFEGEDLKLCYSAAPGARPKEFSSKGGTDKNRVVLAVYKKAK
jgi:uncharacterized protein (TIGR03067 family)